MNKNPFWVRKELADFKDKREASNYYQPPIMSLEEIERLRGKPMMKSLGTMISLWLWLNLMDLITTLIALDMGHTEGNPLVSGLGSAELVVYKVGFTLLALALLVRIKKLYLLQWLCLGMGIVAAWNLIWMIRA